MNTREIASEYRLTHWAQVMQERAQSGLSIKAYCKQLGICGNTYFYWQRRVRAAAAAELGLSVCETAKPSQVCFSEVKVADGLSYPAGVEAGVCPGAMEAGAQLHINVGGIQLTADSTYPVEQLARLVQHLSRPC